MNWRRIPLLPTLLVLAACGYMVHLGLWQLDRLAQKEAMVAQFSAAQANGAEAPFDVMPQLAEPNYYHRSKLDCLLTQNPQAVAGRNAMGESGFAHVVDCQTPEGSMARLVLGWSRAAQGPRWDGGKAQGWIAPGPKLVADPPLAGLQANAKPDPRDLPNNHLSYAVQWFAFAITALAIYGLALRKRLKAEPSP